MRIVKAIVLGLAVLALGFHGANGQAGDKKTEAKKKPNVWTDPLDVPIDYHIQGEYANSKDKMGLQVVARGNGKFDVYILEGGLPGAGWNPKSAKVKVEAKLDADKGVAVFNTKNHQGTIDANKKELYLKSEDLTFSRVERKSPTIEAKPPDGAIVLFDGTNADEWNEKKMVGNLLGVPNTSKRKFTNFKLHIEFRTPFQPTAGGQGRGNSGVYVAGREVQVLDSFGLKGENNECGGIYSERAPNVNMCLPPLVWQTYEIEHRPGKIDPETKKQGPPTITVYHNGVLVHENFALKGGGQSGNIHLQNHGDPVVYRNIWVVEMK